MSSVPAPALKAAAKKLPEVSFASATRETIDGRQIFELTGKDKQGKSHTVKVTATGDVRSSD